MRNNRKSYREECLACGEMILIKNPVKLGQLVNCSSCGEQFEIVELDPIFLDWPMYSDDFMEEDYYESEEY